MPKDRGDSFEDPDQNLWQYDQQTDEYWVYDSSDGARNEQDEYWRGGQYIGWYNRSEKTVVAASEPTPIWTTETQGSMIWTTETQDSMSKLNQSVAPEYEDNIGSTLPDSTFMDMASRRAFMEGRTLEGLWEEVQQMQRETDRKIAFVKKEGEDRKIPTSFDEETKKFHFDHNKYKGEYKDETMKYLNGQAKAAYSKIASLDRTKQRYNRLWKEYESLTGNSSQAASTSGSSYGNYYSQDAASSSTNPVGGGGGYSIAGQSENYYSTARPYSPAGGQQGGPSRGSGFTR